MPMKEGYTFNGKRPEKMDSRSKQVKSTKDIKGEVCGTKGRTKKSSY